MSSTPKTTRPPDAITRELALFKVGCSVEERTEVLQITEVFRGKTVDISEATHHHRGHWHHREDGRPRIALEANSTSRKWFALVKWSWPAATSRHKKRGTDIARPPFCLLYPPLKRHAQLPKKTKRPISGAPIKGPMLGRRAHWKHPPRAAGCFRTATDNWRSSRGASTHPHPRRTHPTPGGTPPRSATAPPRLVAVGRRSTTCLA